MWPRRNPAMGIDGFSIKIAGGPARAGNDKVRWRTVPVCNKRKVSP
jgi:hypothetical protein